ncbi:PAS domain S-box protein [Metabacillus sp. 113a]|uniref:PAS domain S-box protein n=1 Tax=Metabacillus sp. 113a TaxID=3404706 RepID=UPI003CE7F406
MKDSITDENLSKLLQIYFNQTNDAIVITELTSLRPLTAHFYHVNRRACEILGCTSEEILQIDPHSLFFSKIAPKVYRSIEEKLIADTHITIEMEIENKYQESIPIEASCHLLEAGEKHFIFYSIKQIARRKREFYQLLSEKETSHVIMNTIQAFVVLLRPNGQIEDWNWHCTYHTGYSYKEAAGAFIWDLMLEKEHRKSAMDYFSGKIDPFPKYYENYWVTKTGGKMLIRWSNKEIYDGDGNVLYIVCTGIDLTENKSYERKLKESHDKIQQLIEHNPDGIAIYENGKLTYLNPEAEKMLGIRCDQASGSLLDRIHPADQKLAYESIRSLLQHETEIAGPVELNFSMDDGSIATVEAKGISDWNQNEASALVMMRDITQRKKAEAEIQTAFNQIQDILCSSVEGILGMNDQGEAVFANSSLSLALHLDNSQIIGKPVETFLNKILANSSLKQLLSEGQPIEAAIETDGATKYFELSANPMRNGKGHVLTFYDQTDRILLENVKYRYYNAITCGITVQNADGDIIFANECASEILGYSSSDILNMNSFNEEWQARDETGQLLKGQEHPSMTTLRTKKEISHFVMGVYNPERRQNRWILLDTRILYADQGEAVEYIIATFQDITDRIEMEKMLKSQEKLALAGNMATAVAHEVRNPLTSVLGFVQLLESSDELNREYLRVMKKELEHIRLITNEFLTLAKPEDAEVVKLNLETEIIEPLIRMLLPDLHDRGIAVEFIRNPDEAFFIDGKADSLKQLFLNFLTNSIEAIPNKGTITIGVMQSENKLIISIEDTGIGIPEERIPFLGEPFYSIKEKGTGLGLLICRKILEDHMGDLTIESTPGTGTKVIVTLPASSGTNSETA